jgi:hypothetical protein
VVPDDAHGAGVRRPHGEGHAADRPEDGVERAHVRAERRPQRLVPSLADEVEIELADGREEAVRVVDRGPLAVVDDLEAVVRHRRAGQQRDPDAALLVACRVPAVRRHDRHVLREVGERADRDPVVAGVGPEDGVRVVVLAVGDRGEHSRVDGDGLGG